jgi:hypothetical protein
MQRCKPVQQWLPADAWRAILSHIAFDDRLTLLRLLSVNKATFELLADQCWRALYHLSLVMPLRQTDRVVSRTAIGFDFELRDPNGRLHLPHLIQRMTTDEEKYFTRENMSFLLAVLLHAPVIGHNVQDGRYTEIDCAQPLRDIHRFQPRDQSLLSLDKDPEVKVYEMPPDGAQTPRVPNEAERLALEHCAASNRRYAMFYAIARDQLVLRDPLPSDPLYRVVLRGEHIFSETRADERGGLFCYKAKRGAESVRMMDIISLNVWRARISSNNYYGEYLKLDEEEEEKTHHEVYFDNGELFGRLQRQRLFGRLQRLRDEPDEEEEEEDEEEERCEIVIDDDDDDTTLDSDMFSDEQVDSFTDDTVSCDVPSASTPDAEIDETDDGDDETTDGEAGDEEEEDDEEDEDDYDQGSDTDDDEFSSSLSSSGGEDELSAELVPLQKIINCKTG